MPERERVLAIALEAAEPKLVRELMTRGEMPALARLAEHSSWVRMAPPTYIGSVPLWPSFNSGLEAEQHRRMYGPWLWEPDRMKILPQRPEPLEHVWARLHSGSVGLFDVAGAPARLEREGFVVRGWGTHNPMDTEHSVWPPEAAHLLGERHPFKCGTEINYRTGNRARELRRLSLDTQRGIRLRGAAVQGLLRRFRPDLAIVNFPELHRAGHWMWHTREPRNPLYATVPDAARSLPAGIDELYRETDRQVGKLIAEAGPGTDVVVFALNGMEPARGLPDLLRPVLIEAGYSVPAKLGPATLGGRALAALKRRTPVRLKQAYYRAMPEEMTLRVAELIPEYDWSATRAFAMPSEQHGWIRFNVAGREAAGIVDPSDYEALGDELETLLRSLVSPSGIPLVRTVLRTGRDDILPDLVVHWADAAHGEVARLGDRDVHAPCILPWLVGQHSPEGFCLAPERMVGGRDTIAPAELQELMLAAADRPAPVASRGGG